MHSIVSSHGLNNNLFKHKIKIQRTVLPRPFSEERRALPLSTPAGTKPRTSHRRSPETFFFSSFFLIRQTAYFELKRISSVRRFLTEDATKTPVTSYILSRLDYCNCLLVGTPNSVIQPLQKIQNFAARLVLLAPRNHHATPLLEKLHWLPISERIKYKVACMCFSAINGSGPAYL